MLKVNLPAPVVLSVQQDLSLSLGNASVERGDLMAVMDLLSQAACQKVALAGREAGSQSSSGAQ